VSKLKQELAQVLNTLISQQGLKKADIAREMGFSRQRLNEIVKGTGNASCEAIEQVIKQLGYEVQMVTVSKAEQVP
jgi:predicted XRE-type DNA-binding protein